MILTLFSYLFKGLGILLLLLILFAFLNFIVKPLTKLKFYKKQGIPTSFFPIMGFVQRDRKHEKVYGDVMAYYKKLPQTEPSLRAMAGNFSSRVDVLLIDPKLIKEFYMNQSLYRKSPTTKILSTLIGNGLLFAEDNVWKNHRKVVSGVFHFDFLKQSVPLMVSTAREFLTKISLGNMKEVDILKESQKITGEIIGRLFFSENLNQHTLRGELLTLFLAEIPAKSSKVFRSPLAVFLLVTKGKLERLAAYREIMKDITDVREVCKNIVKERKASGLKANDLMGLLLETQKAEKEEDRFTDEDVVNEFMTFFLGGMDSTAHLVNMTLYLLAAYPQCLERVQREITESYSIVPSIEGLNRMEYLHAVFKETMRMYGPALGPASRLAQADHNLLDVKIRKGDFVRPMSLCNYFNGKYFEEPEKFKPERWLDRKEGELDSYVFIPFSAGSRNCIGQHQAILAAKIIVSEFVRKFEFKLPEGYELKMTLGSLYEPKQKVLMDLQCK